MAEPTDVAKEAFKTRKGIGGGNQPSQRALDAFQTRHAQPKPPGLPAGHPGGDRPLTYPPKPADPRARTNPFVSGDFSIQNVLGTTPGKLVRDVRQGKPGVMAGSMAGFEAGRRIHPVAALAGGALGAAGGYFATMFAEDIARAVSPEKTEQIIGPAPSVQQKMNDAGEVVLNDLAYGGGAQVFGPLLRLGVKAAGGLTQSGLEMAARARQVGINLSIGDVTESNVLPWITTIFGKFPLIGRPIVEHARTLGGEISTAADRLFITMAPIQAMGAMGRKVDKIADAHFKLFRMHFNKRYEELFKLARQVGAEVPNAGVVRVADDYAELLKRKMSAAAWSDHPFAKWYHMEIGQKLPGVGGPREGAVAAIRGGPVRYKEFMTVDRQIGLIESLERVVKDNPNHNWVPITEPFNKAAADAVAGVSTQIKNKTTGKMQHVFSKRISKMWSEIDAEYSSVLKEIFETRVAKSLNRVTGNRWTNNIVKENSRPPEHTVNILTENNTKSTWQSMSKLIPGEAGRPGQKISRMAGIVGHWLHKGFQRAKEYDVAAEQGIPVLSQQRGDFSLKTWFKHTGLDDPNSIAYEGTREAIRHTNIGWQNFLAFNEALVAAVRSNVPNVSSFIARKVNISGISAIRSFILPGAAAAGGAGAGMVGQGDLMTAGAVIAVGNAFSRFIGNPKWVRFASQAMDTSLQINRRRAAILGLIQMQEDEAGPNSVQLGVPALPSSVREAVKEIPEQKFETGEAAKFLWEGIKKHAKEAGGLTKRTLNELLD
jgi:hypothetical protein